MGGKRCASVLILSLVILCSIGESFVVSKFASKIIQFKHTKSNFVHAKQHSLMALNTNKLPEPLMKSRKQTSLNLMPKSKSTNPEKSIETVPKKTRSNLFLRVVTSLVLAVGVSLWMTSDKVPFTLGFLALSLVAQDEYLKMLQGTGVKNPKALIGNITSLLSSYFAAYYTHYHSLVLPLSSSLLMFKFLIFNNKLATINEVATSFFGMFYLSYLPTFWILIRFLPEKVMNVVSNNRFPLLNIVPKGALLVWFTWAAIASSDIGAYFIGRAFGKNKLSQISTAAGSASPNKSVEGALGGFLCGSLMSLLGAYILQWPHFVTTGLAYGFTLSVVALVGDLTASMMKRDANLKDSGNLLPGFSAKMSSLPPSVDQKSPLLHAWHDPLAGLKAHSNCVRLADLNCDGDSKLCICDLDKKLKVYKGTSLVVEYAILDTPVAMCITYTEANLPRIPCIAVAAGSHIFIYRQLRPYRKWSCPAIDVPHVETEIWNELKTGNMSNSVAVSKLIEARDNGVHLSSRSFDLITLETDVQKAAFITEMKDVQYVQNTLITCMETLKKENEDADGISLLVVGTEAGGIMILPQDPVNSTYLCKLQLPSTPTMISVSGIFDVEWRVSVICRDGKLYSIKNGEVRGTAILSGSVVDLGSQAIAITKQDKLIWVATMDKVVNCYSNRGKRLKGIVLNEDISDIASMVLKRAKVNYILLVALASGDLNMYRELTCIYSFKVENKPILALCFGTYGREESSLIIVHGQNGALTIKMWKRTTEVDSLSIASGPPPEQDIPLPVPKKTKLYVEQTQREREKAPEIHRGFQRDLCKLRLTTARAYVKTLTDGYMGATPLGSADIRIQVTVTGLGPKFLLKVSLQNASTHPIFNARLLFSFDENLYVMGYDENSNQSIVVPIMLPGPKHIIETQILSIDPAGRAGQILLIIQSNNASAATTSSIPLLSASVRMPPSEPLPF